MRADSRPYCDRMSASRNLVSSGSEFESMVGYSRAVRVGAHVAVAGTTGAGPAGDIAAQTRDALRRIEIALQQAGATLADVVRTRIYVTDISRWREVGDVHAQVFGEIRPAATMVEVSALIAPELMVEIEADAYVESRSPEIPRRREGAVRARQVGATLITAVTGSGPYRCGNSIDSGSVGTPGSQRTGESSTAGSMCSSTRSVAPAVQPVGRQVHLLGRREVDERGLVGRIARFEADSAPARARDHSYSHRCTSTAGAVGITVSLPDPRAGIS